MREHLNLALHLLQRRLHRLLFCRGRCRLCRNFSWLGRMGNCNRRGTLSRSGSRQWRCRNSLSTRLLWWRGRCNNGCWLNGRRRRRARRSNSRRRGGTRRHGNWWCDTSWLSNDGWRHNGGASFLFFLRFKIVYAVQECDNINVGGIQLLRFFNFRPCLVKTRLLQKSICC